MKLKTTNNTLEMDVQRIPTMCGMCAVRCPIEVHVRDGNPVWLQGNTIDAGMGTSLCPKGAAGISFEQDDERPQQPMIRTGPRGSGQWRKVSWDEALDYIAERLNKVRKKYGGRAIALSDRSGPFIDLTKSFLKAIGSPNYFDHDCSCGGNAHNASLSVFGVGRLSMGYDIANTKHIVLYGRNIVESLQVKEVRAFMEALDAGAKCTYIDPRSTITASYADRFWRIRPGADYALNQAIIHEILNKKLYDKAFVDRWIEGMGNLEQSVKTTTPEWAEKETGIPAQEIRDFVQEVAKDAPHVIFHPGWMTARHSQSFHVSRSTLIINALFGAIEVPGGLIFVKSPKDMGGGNMKHLADAIPEVNEPRVDGAGSEHPQWDEEIGILHRLYETLRTEKPYKIGAYIAYRHDPLSGLSDPEAQKKAMESLDLLVSIDVNYSETAWQSDVILPEASYLERSNILAQIFAPSPFFMIRQKVMEPRFNTRPAWWIFRELLRRMDLGQYMDFDDIEDIWSYQLQGTGIKIEELKEKGIVSVTDKPTLFDRAKGLRFGTTSGKIEIISPKLTKAGLESLPAYRPLEPLPDGQFRLIFGKVAQLNHAQSTNNPLLAERVIDNPLWIHPEAAKKLGIANGDEIEICSADLKVSSKAFVTSGIHPEAVYLIHGLGRTVPLQTRACNRGVADQRLQIGGLERFDPAGGGLAMIETVVSIEKKKEKII
ncbi:MAG: molybdopterin-dependent oxidoreductase [Bacteroidales bacterium]|nr:molybdopterin-dependent oxidoreductase [Bacteroidales bacterium]